MRLFQVRVTLYGKTMTTVKLMWGEKKLSRKIWITGPTSTACSTVGGNIRKRINKDMYVRSEEKENRDEEEAGSCVKKESTRGERN